MHSLSTDYSKTELDLFSLPPTQVSIDRGQCAQFKPLSALSGESPIEFVVPGHGVGYLDLAQTLRHDSGHRFCGDDNVFENTNDKSGPVNYLLNSIFSQVEVYLNQKMVLVNENTYPYRAYRGTVFNYDEAAKRVRDI